MGESWNDKTVGHGPAPLALRVLVDGPDIASKLEAVTLLAAAYQAPIATIPDAQNRPAAQWSTFDATGPNGSHLHCDVVATLPDLGSEGRRSLARSSDVVIIALETTAEGVAAAAEMLRSDSLRGAAARLVIIGRRAASGGPVTKASLLDALAQDPDTPALVIGTEGVDITNGFALAIEVGLDRVRRLGATASSRRPFSVALLTTMVRPGSLSTASIETPAATVAATEDPRPAITPTDPVTDTRDLTTIGGLWDANARPPRPERRQPVSRPGPLWSNERIPPASRDARGRPAELFATTTTPTTTPPIADGEPTAPIPLTDPRREPVVSLTTAPQGPARELGIGDLLPSPPQPTGVVDHAPTGAQRPGGTYRPEDDPELAGLIKQAGRGRPVLASGVVLILLVAFAVMVLGLSLSS